MLFDGLKALYPDHIFIGEESSSGGIGELKDTPTWVFIFWLKPLVPKVYYYVPMTQ